MLNVTTVIERLREIMQENPEQLKTELSDYNVADIADIFQELKPDERLSCFKLLDYDKAADVMEYLPANLQVELLSDIDEETAAKILTQLPYDAAADVLGDMEEDESETYLEKLPHKFSEEVRELLTYNEDTAGGMMNPVVLTINSDMSVLDVLNYIRAKAEHDNMELYYIYVVDKQDHLLGVVSLRKLLTTPIDTIVEDIMISDIVKLHIDDYSDSVTEEFMKYQYNALPVVDFYNRLKGIITWDDVHDLVQEETTEEIYASSGISTELVDEDEILSGNIFNAIRARTPWLFITLIGEALAVRVADHFEHTVKLLPVVAIFMPLLAGLGGNIGTQSITLMVRGLSTGQVTMSSAVRHIIREGFVGLAIGAAFGAVVALVTCSWQHNIELGIVVGAAMTTNMTLATIIGTLTPFVLKSMKVDPAVASGPVIATTIDVIGLTIYFSMVSAFLINKMI